MMWQRPAVIGAGSWGTALAILLAKRGLPVNLWVHDPALAERLAETRVNDVYLPGYALCNNVNVCTTMHNCLQQVDSVIFAVPSHALRQVALLARPDLPVKVNLVSAAKGLEENTLLRMSEVLHEVFPGAPISVLSGPSFAVEVAAGQPTALVAASSDLASAQQVQQMMAGPNFRVYMSQDVAGVELGGAMKNVIAIAAGVCYGLQLGQNAVAALITRGLAEMSRLAVALGGQTQTLAGLAGLGDLVLTCTGELSRNRAIGVQLAHGRSLAEITRDMRTVAEGIKSTGSVVKLGLREKVSLPISEQMQAVLHGERSPEQAIRILMERSPGGE